MGAVAREVYNGTIHDIEVGAVRAIAGRVHDVDLRIVDRDDKRARKSRTAVVGVVGGTFLDVHVVAAVAAIPLKGVLLVVLNGEVRGVLKVEFVVAAEVDGMNVAGAGAIHGKRSAIERERGILACAHRHPIPLGGIRGGADAGHGHVDVLERQSFAPKGNALVGEVQCVAIAVDGEILAQVKASGLGISEELDGRIVSVLGSSKRLIEGSILCAVKLGDHGGGGSLRLGSGDGRFAAQGNGGNRGDGSVIAGRGVSIGGSVISDVGGRILGIGRRVAAGAAAVSSSAFTVAGARAPRDATRPAAITAAAALVRFIFISSPFDERRRT